MANLKLTIPATRGVANSGTSTAYDRDSVIQSNTQMLQSIMATYGNTIRKVAAMENIPYQIIASKIAVESAGRNMPINKFGAIGVAQVTAAAAYDTIKAEARNNALTPTEVATINAAIPNLIEKGKLYGYNVVKDFPQVKSQINKALTNPEFNILMSTLYMGQLFDRFTKGGYVELHKVFAGYNWGANRSYLQRSVDTTALTTSADVPMETRQHVLKLLGKFGFLDLAFNKRVI